MSSETDSKNLLLSTAELELMQVLCVRSHNDRLSGRSTVMKLDNRISQEPNPADMSLMFILGVTVGAAVPLLLLASG